MPRPKLAVGTTRYRIHEYRGRDAPFVVQSIVRLDDGKDEYTNISPMYRSREKAEAFLQGQLKDEKCLREVVEAYYEALLAHQEKEIRGGRLYSDSHRPAAVRSTLEKLLHAHLDRSLLSFRSEDAVQVMAAVEGAVETRRTYRARCRACFEFARERRLWPQDRPNPFAGVKVKGKRHKGKRQLEPDPLLDKFVPQLGQDLQRLLADPRDPQGREALFVGLVFYCSTRPSEIRLRRVRDARSSLNIAFGKVESAKGRLELGVMAEFVRVFTMGRADDEFLFPEMRRPRWGRRAAAGDQSPQPCSPAWTRSALQRLCERAGLDRNALSPYSLRGMAASFEVVIAARSDAFDASFQAALAKGMRHRQEETFGGAYVNEAARAEGAAAQQRAQQARLAAAVEERQWEALRNKLREEVLNEGLSKNLSPAQLVELLALADAKADAARKLNRPS